MRRIESRLSLIEFGTKSRNWPPPRRAARRYPERVARQLAHALQRRVDSGEFADYADMAWQAPSASRARARQMVDLLLLVADIQEEILRPNVAPGVLVCGR